MTAAMLCPPSPHSLGLPPSRDHPPISKHTHCHALGVPATTNSPGTLAADQHQVGHQEHGTAERDSGCQPCNPPRAHPQAGTAGCQLPEGTPGSVSQRNPYSL